MSVDPSREEDPLEQLLLTAYPNPERKGCPGRDVLAQLANKQRDPKDDLWYHVWHCSPCYSEFKQMRDARWRREHNRAAQIRRRTWLSAAAGLTVVAGLSGVAWLVHQEQRANALEIARVTLDLSAETTTRGGGQDLTVKLPPLPRKLDEVKLILPRFSDEGDYQIGILRSQSSRTAVALAQGATMRTGNELTVTVRLDLDRIDAGTYWLGTRLRGGDQVYYYPLQVR